MSIQRLPDSQPVTTKTRPEPPRRSGEKEPSSFADVLARGQQKLRQAPVPAAEEQFEERRHDVEEIDVALPTLAAGQAVEIPAGSVAQVAAAIGGSEGTTAAGGATQVGANQQLMDRLVEQVVTAARTLDGGRGQHLQVSLNLGALGQAEVELRKDAEGALDLLFRCDDAAAESEIQQNLNDLRRRLLNRGLRPGRLAVRSASEAPR